MHDKTTYKLFLVLMKYQPAFMCLLYLTYYTFLILDYDVEWGKAIGKESFVSLIYFYVASAVFKFCVLHRLFIHFLAICNITDNSDASCILKIIAGMFLFFLLILYQNAKRHN